MGLFGNRRGIELAVVLDRRKAQFLAVVHPHPVAPKAPEVIWAGIERQVRASGSTGAEADRALAHLIQAVAVGRVGKEEFAVIREDAPALAAQIARAFGMKMTSAILLAHLGMMQTMPILHLIHSEEREGGRA